MTKPTTVRILGSGTCVPSLARSSCSVWVDTDEAGILLDVGPGTMHRLLAAGVRIFDVTHVFLSHFHPDHVGELVSFLFANKYPNARLRTRPLTLIGGNGFLRFFEGLKNVFGDWIVLSPKQLQLREMDTREPDRIHFHNTTVDTAPVVHRPESLAYRITGADGKSVVYSGDTDESESLVTLAAGADIFICETAMPDELKTTGHLTPSQAGRMATRARVGKLVLTHFYPECESADLISQCRRTYHGPVLLAEDLMSIPFS